MHDFRVKRKKCCMLPFKEKIWPNLTTSMEPAPAVKKSVSWLTSVLRMADQTAFTLPTTCSSSYTNNRTILQVGYKGNKDDRTPSQPPAPPPAPPPTTEQSFRWDIRETKTTEHLPNHLLLLLHHHQQQNNPSGGI